MGAKLGIAPRSEAYEAPKFLLLYLAMAGEVGLEPTPYAFKERRPAISLFPSKSNECEIRSVSFQYDFVGS